MGFTIQQAFTKFKDSYLAKYNPSYEQLKAMNNIIVCRTEKLGTRIYKCETCGQMIFSYDSCKDRHCPNCQNYKKEKWIDNHQDDIFNTPYFHVVTTVPVELHEIFYHNKQEMYNLLFKASTETIIELSKDKKYLGVKVGITAMLHTWSQTANYHPHIHMIVTGGGINDLGEYVYSKEDFFLPVKVISRVFRGKLLSFIKSSKNLKFYNNLENLNNKKKLNDYLRPLYEKEWVCYCKEPFKNVKETYNYLARYAFRVCMTNDRIENITDTHVTFKYRDRKDHSKTKTMTIKGEEFIRKFLLHVLPKGFSKVRYYGIIAGKGKKERIKKLKILTRTALQKISKRTKLEILNSIIGKVVTKCKCGGELILIETKRYKPPPQNFTTKLLHMNEA